MDSDRKWAIGMMFVSFALAMFFAISLVKYKYYTEKYIEEYFSQCIKISEEKIQCPMPK